MDKSTTEIILESISDGVFTVDYNWLITSFNRAAEAITGIDRDEAVGRHCWEVFRSNMCEHECALKKTMKEGKPFVSSTTHIVDSQKRRIPITVSTSLLKDSKGNILGGVEVFRDHSLVEELRKEISSNFQLQDMVSRNPLMKKIFNILPLIAESGSTVLVEGETGTGKEIMARAIHNLSLRKDKPFIAINCGSLPDTLLESELFGYKAGAFTHAVKDKPGLFAAAEGGTLLLDEIGDTSRAFQVRLLRVLEERAFQPLGSVKTIKSNVRLIAATNKNLLQMVEEEKFRIDLFYRINVVKIDLPPLRERMEDIPILIEHFIERLNKIQGKSVQGLEQKALEKIMSHNFPGNIRELQNIIEHAFILCSHGRIALKHLPSNLHQKSDSDLVSISNISGSKDIYDFKPSFNSDSNISPVKSAEIKMIEDALRRNRYNRSAAARELGVHKSTLFRKIARLGIELPDGVDGRSAYDKTSSIFT